METFRGWNRKLQPLLDSLASCKHFGSVSYLPTASRICFSVYRSLCGGEMLGVWPRGTPAFHHQWMGFFSCKHWLILHLFLFIILIVLSFSCLAFNTYVYFFPSCLFLYFILFLSSYIALSLPCFGYMFNIIIRIVLLHLYLFFLFLFLSFPVFSVLIFSFLCLMPIIIIIIVFVFVLYLALFLFVFFSFLYHNKKL